MTGQGVAGRPAEVQYDAIFDTTHERLTAFLGQRCGLAPPASADIARELLAVTVYRG